MKILSLDMETFYNKEFSLSRLTTEEYVRDDRFEVIGVAVKEDNNETVWQTGTHDEISRFLYSFDWCNSALLAHNSLFDASILNWKFGIKPKAILDTLSMARAIHGTEVGGSLAKLVTYYGLGVKGTEVLNALGKRRDDFSEAEINAYGGYCKNDVELTYALFKKLIPSFKLSELQLIDLTIRMFTEPVLTLDRKMLEAHILEVQYRKEKLLEEAGVETRDDLMSNPKFAKMLEALGVEPPMKISARTGKEALALAKSDEGFKALADYPDERVQALVSARLGNKSTLEETRTQRFIEISKRGSLPIPLSYYAAHTGRWGGADKINLQNLPSRGDNANKLKKSIRAPEGYMIIDADSSQIEARVLAWLSGQDDLTEAFRKGEDVYKIMATAIYSKSIEEITKEERFVGKTTILGCGYGMGATKFGVQLKTFGTEITEDEAQNIIRIYRQTYPRIPTLWKEGGKAIEAMIKNQSSSFGNGCVTIHGEQGLLLPNGMFQRYPNLRKVKTEDGEQYGYDSRNGLVKIYGGKLVENICQALARCIIGEQMLKISKNYRVVLTVHDAVACIVKEEEVEEAMQYVTECMRWTPDWAEGLPVNCEAGFGRSYGEC
jgi:DNA polymerase